MNMDKNDFDIDFNFDEEYEDFDPKTLLGDETFDEDIDLDQFTDEELGLNLSQEVEEEEEPVCEEEPAQEDEELPYDPLEGFPREEYDEEEEPQEDYPVDDEPEEDFQDPEEDFPDEDEDDAPQKPRKERKHRKVKVPKLPKVEFHTPKFLIRFYDVYFAPLTNKSMLEEPQDPNNPRRRRRKSRSQVFKEVYLPPILVGVCMVLVLSFAMGAVSNAIAQHTANKAIKESQQVDASNAAVIAEQEYNKIMSEAERLAAGYDYQAAIEKLESFGDMSEYPDMSAKSAEYATLQNQMVEYKDPSMIPNLSFHVLVHDMERALRNGGTLKGNYNKNFVSTKEFTAILSQLYNNGYVLVDFDSFVKKSVGVDGNEMFFPDSIFLPANKKPIMLTETMVNYFSYMLSDKEDGSVDATGDGFATKLLVQNGEIKAEYVDENGTSSVGDYDLVPILETFIKAHPDFVYRGARATLAVCGYDGVFGYRINTNLISTKGNAYHEAEVQGAKELVQALRNKGYRIACYSYKNADYKTYNANQIKEDMQNWATQITPVLGNVDTFVFARNSDLTDYTGTSYDVLYTQGFRYFVSKGDEPWAEVNSTRVRQKRLLVTGNTMQWHTKQFTGIFDCGAVLDVNIRGNVPND